MEAILIASTTPHLVGIDSLRAPLFETTGPAGSKGVIMPFFTALTRVSNSLARNGLTLVATVNPMDDDPGYVEAFLSKISSAVPAFINVAPQSDAQRGVFTGNIATRSNRAGKTFQFDSTVNHQVEAEEIEFVVPAAEHQLARFTNLQLKTLQESK
jgi:hypothetical protein